MPYEELGTALRYRREGSDISILPLRFMSRGTTNVDSRALTPPNGQRPA